jgi:hypothetical protein
MYGFNWHNFSALELVEQIAEYHDSPYCDEEAVSAIFNEEVRPSVVEEYGKDDEIAINEAFNNWTDMLCKDGELHELQYENYTYLGKDV